MNEHHAAASPSRAVGGLVLLVVAAALVAVGVGFIAHGLWLLVLYGWNHL